MKRFIVMMMVLALVCTGCGTNIADEDDYKKYGINCLDQGKYEEAIDAFQLALNQVHGTVSEREIDICFYKAQAQYMSGKFEDAIATYTAVIEFNEDPDAYFLRGRMYLENGDTDNGIKDFNSAMANDSSNYELFIAVSEVLKKNDLSDAAEQVLNKALDIKGDKVSDKTQKGRISLLLGDTEHAINYLQDALERGSIEANFYLAMTYEEIGNTDMAEQYFNIYMQQGQADSTQLCELAQVELKRGKNDMAITYLTGALALESVPNRQEILKCLVVAYENKGDFETARTTMEEYVELFPADEEAQRELVFLQTR